MLQMPPARLIGSNERAVLDNVLISGGCVIESSHLTRSVVFSNVTVNRGCRIDGCLLLPDCDVGEESRLYKVILDNGCKLPPRSEIGGNPERDRKLYRVTDQGVTIVTRSMLGGEQNVGFLGSGPDRSRQQ